VAFVDVQLACQPPQLAHPQPAGTEHARRRHPPRLEHLLDVPDERGRLAGRGPIGVRGPDRGRRQRRWRDRHLAKQPGRTQPQRHLTGQQHGLAVDGDQQRAGEQPGDRGGGGGDAHVAQRVGNGPGGRSPRERVEHLAVRWVELGEQPVEPPVVGERGHERRLGRAGGQAEVGRQRPQPLVVVGVQQAAQRRPETTRGGDQLSHRAHDV
jgi:hypothetical protein